ncbi:MAG: hypothetical protein ACI841_000639 [Planctomycetota bacterium]
MRDGHFVLRRLLERHPWAGTCEVVGGRPKGDKIETNGAEVLAKVGVPSSVVARHLLHLKARDNGSDILCIYPKKSLAHTYYKGGSLLTIWNGWTEDVNSRALTAVARNDQGEAVARAVIKNGRFNVEGFGDLGVGYTAGQEHTVLWFFNVKTRMVAFGVNTGTTFKSTGRQPFLAPKAGGLKSLYFDYEPDFLHPLPEASYYFEAISTS